MYFKERQQRTQLLQSHQGEDVVLPNATVPYSVIYSDLSSDKTHTTNVCEAGLVGVKSVRIE